MNMFSLCILQSKSMPHHHRGYNTTQKILTNLFRYLFDPCIDGHFDNTAATLDLALCCIWYLCQSHHDAWIQDDEIATNLISGDYRLHSYAVTMWSVLIERYISLNGSRPLSQELIRALDYLARERSSSEFTGSTEPVGQSQKPGLKNLKNEWPKLHTLISNQVQFQRRYSNSEYHLSKGEMTKPWRSIFSKIQVGNQWTGFDPLTICHISISIYIQFDGLLCKRIKHEGNCNCKSLERHYGRRPFKCDVLGCSFRRHGFATKALRDSHIKHHDRPWKCAVQSCEYAEMGFLSRRMKDEHVESNHQESKPQARFLQSNPDVDELQPLFFDLIRLDKVDEVKSILNHFGRLKVNVQEELENFVASSGSASMAQVLCNGSYRRITKYCTSSIEALNFETLRYFLSKINEKAIDYLTFKRFLQAILQSGSLEIFKECENYIINSLLKKGETGQTLMPTCVSVEVIRTTAKNPDREHFLLSIWAALGMGDKNERFWKRQSEGLRNVARTTCSLVLAKPLLENGAEVDFTITNGNSPTPLHQAARHDSPQAAELMKFFLYNGANPELCPQYRKIKISDEKGPRNISKWIGMSWDELVEMVKVDRERGFYPPEYRSVFSVEIVSTLRFCLTKS